MPLDGQTLGLALLIIGILMVLAEVAAPGFFILVPATVLIILGGMGLIAPDLLLQWYTPILAAVIAIPMTFVSIKMYQRLAPPAPPETTVATSLLGKEGVVVTDVVPDALTGKVRIENDTWSASSDHRIPAGAKIKVVSSEGVHVIVQEAS